MKFWSLRSCLNRCSKAALRTCLREHQFVGNEVVSVSGLVGKCDVSACIAEAAFALLSGGGQGSSGHHTAVRHHCINDDSDTPK
ncbi:hypothetical protein RB12153 [Rhodopirellula baltica SH 1]|uniref:Uncharacterized protein n=1 Tax=Rhodopirellula baltica (strain DSM 10527 / NCIMB 13988 / SH1) TaxID=243090 RepID=Q7UJ38_RHOBA|nr:hypothetical protein RB12153 [Rhodopirellula baltica SH 1]